MFAFVLGTSPTFFGVTVLAGSLAKVFQKYFYPIVAMIILGLGLYTINGGFNLVGMPLIPAAVPSSIAGVEPQQTAVAESTSISSASALSNTVRINVLNSGYEPEFLAAPAGKPISLVMVSKNVHSCSRAFVIPALNLSKLLPANGETVLEIPAQPAGTSLEFTCSMGMYTGVIHFQ